MSIHLPCGLLGLLFSFSLSGITGSKSYFQTTNSVQISHDDQAIADESNTSEWLAYGRTHSETRFSPLTDINKENVDQLEDEFGFKSSQVPIKDQIDFLSKQKTNSITSSSVNYKSMRMKSSKKKLDKS